MEDSRQSLLADALGRLGRNAESAPIRQALFERSLSVFDLHRWLEHLPDACRPDARARARGLPRGETAIYRALLTAILDRAYARAYGHAARYWSRLSRIAAAGVSLRPLASHEEFEAIIRSRHARR